MDWDELGCTGMNWDGHRSGCGASENLEVAPGGLWVILGWTGMNWEGLGGTGALLGHQYGLLGWTGMDWDGLGWTGMNWDELGWP